MSDKEQVAKELAYLKGQADAGKIEAFLCVDIQRNKEGRIIPTVTVIAPGEADQKQVDTVTNCLHGIAQALREIYDPPVVVKE